MRLILAVVLAIAACAANAQMYRWTDANGRKHYTSTPPPPGAKSVQKVGGSAPAAEAAGASAEPFAVQQARKEFPVTLYSTPGCEACGEARKLLNTRGVPFKEISVTEDAQIEQLKQTVGSNSVPAMLVGKTVHKGFEEGTYNRALDAAGYPRAGILPPRKQVEPGPADQAAGKPAAQAEPAAAPPVAGPYSPDSIAAPKKR